MGNTSDLLIRLRADVGQAERALGGVAGLLGKLGSNRGFQLGALGGGLGVSGILAKATQASMQFGDAFADVIRTVNDADKVGGFDKLKGDLIDLSKKIPVTATELANIASAGGQMNVPADQLVDFTRVVAEMGKGTALSTETAAEGLGKLANVTGEHDWERLASEIVAVGNVNVGGVGQLLDVSQRIALVGHQLGLGVPEILAIGGAIGDAGIEAEMGGSAVSRIFLEMQQSVAAASRGVVTGTKDVRDAMQKMGDLGDDLGLAEEQRGEMFTRRGRLKKGVSKSSLHAADLRIMRLKREQADARSDLFDLQHPGQKKLDAFAEMAGLSSDQFGAEFRSSPFNAFQDVLRGLHGRSSDEQQRLLDKAGINNIRDIETLAGLSGNPGHITELLDAAQGQATNPTALQQVADTKFSSTLSQQQIIANQVTAKLIEAGDKIAPELLKAEGEGLKLLDDAQGIMGVFNTAPSWMQPFIDGLDKAGIGMDKLVIAASLLQGIGGGGIAGTAARLGIGALGMLGPSGLAIAGALGLGVAGANAVNVATHQDLLEQAAQANAEMQGGITVNIGDISAPPPSSNYDSPLGNNLGPVVDAVVAALTQAWNAAAGSQPVKRPLGGSYSHAL